MKILLTGYAGLLGRHIARALKRDGHAVRVVLHQRTVTRTDFRNEADELLWGSLEDPDVMTAALEGVEGVVHSAWKFSRQDAARPTVNEVVTEELFRRSIRSGVKRFAFISSVAVYGMETGTPGTVSEDTPAVHPAGGFIYPAEKVAAEQFLRSIPRNNLALGILRPGPIFDDAKSPVKKVLGLVGLKLAIGFGTGRNPMPYIHAADVGDAVALWMRSGIDGSLYNVTPDHCAPHRDWLVAWGRQHGMDLTPFFLRNWFMHGAASAATLLKRAMGKAGKVDVEYALAAAGRSLVYSNSRLRQDLRWQPVHTNRYMPGDGRSA